MTAKKPAPAKKASTKRVAAKKRASAPEEILKLPSGVGDDLIPLDLLLRYNTFVERYLQTLDCAGAARDAGWVGKNLPQQKGYGAALLRNVYVRTAIERQYRAIIAKTGATVERVWEEISYTAFLDPVELYDADGSPLPLTEIPAHARRAVTGYKVKTGTFGEDGEFEEREIKHASKDAALAKLMALHRMTDNDKYVVVSGDEFLSAMEEGRQRAATRGK